MADRADAVTGVVQAIGAALLLGGVMTAGDFVWERFALRYNVINGVIHGAVMCLCIGAVIGARAGRPGAGLAAGPAIGVLAAAAYYAAAGTLGWGAMLPAWMLFWICFAVLQAWLRPTAVGRAVLPGALLRGLIAAVLSGLAFYAISGIWTNPSPGGPNYPVHFVLWSFAFLPGFLALLLAQREAASR